MSLLKYALMIGVIVVLVLFIRTQVDGSLSDTWLVGDAVDSALQSLEGVGGALKRMFSDLF
jgi:hypothetical protein